jgi:hypothetical protein
MRRLAAVLLGSIIALSACSSDAPSSSTTVSDGTSPASGEPQGTKTYTGLERNHVDTPVNYPQNPPVGGPHNPVWQTCQFYDKPILKERGVHSMEHGAVWITYSPELPAAQVEVLKQLAAPGHEILVSPYPGLPTPVVASAWGKQLQLQSASDARLAQFVHYFENGPQTPETDTPCAGGTTATP